MSPRISKQPTLSAGRPFHGLPRRPFVHLTLICAIALLAVGCSSNEQRAQSYYQEGMKFLASHENAKAEIEFKNAVKLKPDLLPAWRELAKLDESRHQLQPLVATLRTIISLDPKDSETKLKLARLMLVGNAADQALKTVNEVIDQDGPKADALALRGVIFYRLKDPVSAVKDAQAALETDPTNLTAVMILAEDQMSRGDASGALHFVESKAGDHANDIGVKLLKIRAYEQMKDPANVEAQLRQLVELHPKEPAFRKQLVRFYITQHRDNDAEAELRTIAAEDTKNATSELDLVRFLAAIKGPGAAQAELLDRIKAGGDVFTYQLALADLDFSRGNYSDSVEILQTIAADKQSPEHAVAAKIKLAEQDLARKDVPAAESIVSDILAGDKRNANALKIRAVIKIDRSQFEPAISDLREALNDQPRSAELMLLLAVAYERSGSVELAEKQFADASRTANYDANVGLQYVGFLRRHGSLQRAEDVLTDLTNRNPRNVAVLSALADLKLVRQDWAGAQEVSEAIRKIGDRTALADEILGIALGGQNKTGESITALQSAAAAAPAATLPMTNLVREYVRAKEPDKAKAYLQSVLKTNPSNAEALVLLGSVNMATNAPDQAQASFAAAIEKQPKDPAGYRALAELYLGQKNIDGALKTVRAGLKEIPDNVALRTMLAGLLEDGGDYEGAIAEYEALLKLQPGSVVVANNLASLLADHRSDPESLEQAKTLAAMLRKSPVPQFKDTLGWVSYRSGNFKDALPLLQDAATAMPDAAVVHYHLGMGYAATGQNDKAAEAFKTALSKAKSGSLADTIQAELKKTTSR